MRRSHETCRGPVNRVSQCHSGLDHTDLSSSPRNSPLGTMKVDNPWGLMIVFSAFMIQLITFGYSFSFGVYIVELNQHFNTSSWLLALIGSVNIGVSLASGPLASLLMRCLSYRTVALIGAALSSAGMLLMPFTPNVELMLLFHGVIAGFGFCLLYIPSFVLSGLYYNEHRSLATGVATAGSGLGSILYPLLTQHLINVYGWRGSMLVLAGINLNTLWLSGLLRPVPARLDKEEKSIQQDGVDMMLLPEKEKKHGQVPEIEPELQSLCKVKKEENGDVMYEENKKLLHSPHTMIEENGTMWNKPSADTNQEKNGNVIIEDTFRTSTRETNLRTKHASRRKGSILTGFTTVLKNFPFDVYFVNNLLLNFGDTLVVILAPDYFHHIGFSPDQASAILSYMGIGYFLGCTAGGVLGNLRTVNRLNLFITVNITMGVEGFLIHQPFAHSYALLCTVCSVWGFSWGLVDGICLVMTADLVGELLMGDAAGIVTLACGLGCIMGPAIGGKLQEDLGNEEASFYFANSIITLSGVIMLLIPLYKRLKKKETNQDGNTHLNTTVKQT